MVPNIIEINPTELCNRKCSFCARSEDYPNQNLNLDLRGAIIIRKRLEEMDWRGSLKLTGQGEPTLNKKIIRIAQALQSHNWELTTITNGDFLHNIDSKYFKVFDKITISCYEKEKFEDYKKFDVEVRKQWLPENQTLFNNCGGSLKSAKKLPMQRQCYTPFYRAYIDWNLDVRLCCHDWKYKHTFGNLKDKTFKEIWYCKEFQELRKQLKDGNRAQASSACSECNANGKMNVRTNTTDGKSTFENWKYDKT
jgi:MoaA/NifB/PqqE/SkfB family radical SAM enzyme